MTAPRKKTGYPVGFAVLLNELFMKNAELQLTTTDATDMQDLMALRRRIYACRKSRWIEAYPRASAIAFNSSFTKVTTYNNIITDRHTDSLAIIVPDRTVIGYLYIKDLKLNIDKEVYKSEIRRLDYLIPGGNRQFHHGNIWRVPYESVSGILP